MASIYDRITQPLTDLPSRMARKISPSIGPSESSSNVLSSAGRGFLSGAVEGAGDLLSDATSPLSLVMMGLGLSRGIKNLRGLMSPVGPSSNAIAQIAPKSIYSVPNLPSAVPLNNKMLLQDQAARVGRISDPMKARELESELAYMNRKSGLPSPELGRLPEDAISPSRGFLDLLLNRR